MGAQHPKYRKYNSSGVLVEKTLQHQRVGWVKILDIIYEDDKKIKIKVEADSSILFLYYNRNEPLVLKKNNVNYLDIVSKLIKGDSLYIETGMYDRYSIEKIMVTSLVDPSEITLDIIFGRYTPDINHTSYYKVQAPDVFSVSKTAAHRNCEKYNLLVSDVRDFRFIQDQNYRIKAVNRFDQYTYVITNMQAI